MSTKRRLTSEDAGPSKKGPHGGRLCRWCKKEVFPPYRTYCSDVCCHEWRLRSDSTYLRSQLFCRDKGRCTKCGLDTVALRMQLYELGPDEREKIGKELGIDSFHARNLRLWEADHVVPVFKGGGVELGNDKAAGISSFKTLCIKCHQSKTLMDVLLPTP